MANLDQVDGIPDALKRPSQSSVPQTPHGRAAFARANKTRRKKIDSGSENESSDVDVADDEDEEAIDEDDDGDDESDEPAAFAPPRGHKKHNWRKAGQLAEYRRMFHSEDPVLYEDPQELFGGSIEDDDDDFYRAVDDISDDDGQNDEMFQPGEAYANAAASLLREQTGSPFYLPDPEHEVDYILDQVDGLSAYGFGEDLDTGDGSGECSAPSEGGDPINFAERHVHFGSDVDHMNAHGKSTSPSLTRALLPSAMPAENEKHIYALGTTYQTTRHNVSVKGEDAYDSDATEVISRPPTPVPRSSSITNVATIEVDYTTSTTTKNAISRHQAKRRSFRRRKGPPCGIFKVDQDRSWAILDSTGKKILQIPAANTNRHAWLDEMSQSISAPSSSASPLTSSLNLHGEGEPATVASAAGKRLAITIAVPSTMMASLSGKNANENDHGQTTGSPKAFFSKGLQLVGGDYAISPEPESDAYDDADPPNTKKSSFPLHEFLEDLGDEDTEDADSELPLYAPADEILTGDNDGLFGHLSNVDVTAFRRSADPMSVSRPGTSYSYDPQNSPIAAAAFALPAAAARTPTTSHKRKGSSTPYQDEKIYGNVTPVERKVVHVSKRRKIAV